MFEWKVKMSQKKGIKGEMIETNGISITRKDEMKEEVKTRKKEAKWILKRSFKRSSFCFVLLY